MKGRMWDNEQILLRCLALAGCGAAQKAGRWDEEQMSPAHSFSQ